MVDNLREKNETINFLPIEKERVRELTEDQKLKLKDQWENYIKFSVSSFPFARLGEFNATYTGTVIQDMNLDAV